MSEIITIGETMTAFTPTQDVPLRYADRFSKHCVGAESNTAIALCRLGYGVKWVSRLGGDEFGRYILQQLRGEGVDTEQVVFDPQAPTGIMFKEVRATGETRVQYYREGSAFSSFSAEDVPEQEIKNSRVLHLTGIFPALSESCRAAAFRAAEIAKENGVLFSFDPNIRFKLWSIEEARPVLIRLLRLCDIALLGQAEAKQILGTQTEEESVGALLKMGISRIGLKLGARGAVAADADRFFRIPPYPAAVVDTVGAGDAFNAGFLCGILEDKPLKECGFLGNVMGSFAVGGKGDTETLPTRTELERSLRSEEEITR